MWAYALARLLDRGNAVVVRRRLAGVRAAAATPLEEPSAGGAFVRVGEPAPVETWRREQGDWLATRCRARGEARAALVFLHGWLATSLHLRVMGRALAPLRRRGVELWLPRLPAHVERTPAGWVSGAACLSPDAAATASTIAAAAREACELGAWLGRRVPAVGVWGTSLGGWVAAVSASRWECWRAVALWTPVVDPVGTWRASPLVEPLRRAAGGVEPEAAAERLAVAAPVRLRPAVAPEAVRVFAGRYDDVVAPADVRRFAGEWSVAVNWYPAGHISILLSPRARRDCRAFVAQRLLAGD